MRLARASGRIPFRFKEPVKAVLVSVLYRRADYCYFGRQVHRLRRWYCIDGGGDDHTNNNGAD